MEEEMRGTNRQCDLVPVPISHPIRKYFRPGLPIMQIVVSNLIPQPTALQFKIAVCKGTNTIYYPSEEHNDHLKSNYLPPGFFEPQSQDMKSDVPFNLPAGIPMEHPTTLKWRFTLR